jgi:hypothetical protein
MRQGRLNVATWVMVNGKLGSGAFVPALIWAWAAVDDSVASSTALDSNLIDPSFL